MTRHAVTRTPRPRPARLHDCRSGGLVMEPLFGGTGDRRYQQDDGPHEREKRDRAGDRRGQVAETQRIAEQGPPKDRRAKPERFPVERRTDLDLQRAHTRGGWSLARPEEHEAGEADGYIDHAEGDVDGRGVALRVRSYAWRTSFPGVGVRVYAPLLPPASPPGMAPVGPDRLASCRATRRPGPKPRCRQG
jgi:hypothetical protein